MIEKIKELDTNTQHHFVSADEARFLHDSEVRIEMVRIAKTVASLRKGNGRARTRSLWTWHIPRIERSLAARLYKQCAWIRRPTLEHLRRPTRVGEWWDYGSRPAGMGPALRAEHEKYATPGRASYQFTRHCPCPDEEE
jgi:hypothetical protein